jgi:hypothetical protein
MYSGEALAGFLVGNVSDPGRTECFLLLNQMIGDILGNMWDMLGCESKRQY